MKAPNLVLIFLAIAGCKSRNFQPVNGSNFENRDKIKVVLFGDIQLAGAYRNNESLFKQIPIDKKELTDSALLVNDLDKYSSIEAIRAELPSVLINTGDITDLNDAQKFTVQGTSGQQTESLDWKINEWESVLKKFNGLPPIYPTVGNHEAYAKMEFVFQNETDGKLRWIGGEKGIQADFLDGSQRKSSIQKRFTNLLDTKKVTFMQDSATYLLNEKGWCLFSIDTNSLAFPEDFLEEVIKDKTPEEEKSIRIKYQEKIDRAKTAQLAMLNFAKESISKCGKKPVIALSHFPIFSGMTDDIIDKKGRKKHKAELYDKIFKKLLAIM